MIIENASLKKYNTFGLTIKADRLVTFRLAENARNYFRRHGGSDHKLLVTGAGSNILFTGDYHGTVIHPEMDQIRLIDKKNDHVIISSGAGVVWDKLVEMTVKHGFGGLENLSHIPGNVGAVPVQNIGAYGAEAKDSICKVMAINMIDGSESEFSNSECRFAYRDSIFKHELKGQYLITEVWFRLSTRPLLRLSYGSLREEIVKMGAESLENARKVVISIRQSKLPDPSKLGNAGSFFRNPVVPAALAEELKSSYPCMPVFSEPSGDVKLAAGWLIEQCGWKGRRRGDAGIHDKQALVIVNHGNATGKELFELSEQVRSSVLEKFGIALEREVEVI